MRVRQDFTGQKFGRLTVIGVEVNTSQKTVQICQCECGNILKVHTYRLKKGQTKSCGCYSRDMAKERMSEIGAFFARKYQMNKPLAVQGGDVFGKLTVIEECEPITEKTGRRRRAVLCQCGCGKECKVRVHDLLTRNTKSCGCLVPDYSRTTHGHFRDRRGSPTYISWNSVMDRCHNPHSENFRKYGGSGITVHERWHKFANFLKDMGERPSGTTIHRLNPSKGYEPRNCIWADSFTQNTERSKRRTDAQRIVDYEREIARLTELVESMRSC